MLNPFPDLLNFSFFAPFILRVVIGLIFFDLGFLFFRGEKERWSISLATLKVPSPNLTVKILGIIQMVCGLALVIGFYTQLAALVLALFSFVAVYVEYKDPAILKRSLVFYILLLAILLSLLLTGAGAFAIDLPL